MTETLYYTDKENARRYVDIVASLSQLGEQPEYLGREMLLSNYSGVQPSMTELAHIEDELSLVEEAASRLVGHPRDYMAALLRSTRAVISILKNEDRPYLDLVRDIIEVDFRPIPESESERLREELDEGLGRLGYKGSLKEKTDAWLAETSLTGDAVIEFGRSILESARRETMERVVELPPGEGIDSFTGIRDVFYSGRSAYTGDYRGWLHFNIDKDWQRDVFVHVLCHEAYPGHQTFYSLWDWLFRQGKWPLEAAFYQRNAPTNTVFEGGPEIALQLLGWDQGDSREAASLHLGEVYADLGRIAMNNACLWVNTGEMDREEAVELMVDHLVLRSDAERAYGFFTDRVARTHYPQYYYGRRIAVLARQRLDTDSKNREKLIDILYRTPHTTSTFIKAVAEASGQPFDPFAY